MATFKTEYEKVKWTKLERQASQTFDRLKKGTATKEDLKVAQLLISQYGDLATSVFNSGVDAINKLAEDRIKEIEIHRERLDKPKLTEEQISKLNEQAVSKAIKDEGVELVLAIEDIINKGNTDLKSKFESLSKGNIEQPIDNSNNITLNKVHSLLMDIANRPYPRETNEKKESLFNRAAGEPLNTSKAGPDKEFEVNNEAAINYLKSKGIKTDTVEKSLNNGENSEDANDAAKDVSEALNNNTVVSKKMAQLLREILNPEQFKKTMDALNNTSTDSKDNKKDKNEDFNESFLKETKRKSKKDKDGFFSRLTDWVSKKYDKTASRLSRIGHKFTGTGLMGLLTRALVLELAGADILGKITDFANPKKIQDYAEEAYNWLKKSFTDLINWIAQKTGLAPEGQVKQEQITKYDTPQIAIGKVDRNLDVLRKAKTETQKTIAALEERQKTDPNNPILNKQVNTELEKLDEINAQEKVNQELGDKYQLRMSDSQKDTTPAQKIIFASPKGPSKAVNGSIMNRSSTTGGSTLMNPLNINTSSTVVPAFNPDSIDTGNDLNKFTKAQGGTVGSMQSTPDFVAATDPSIMIFNNMELMRGH